MSNRRSVTLSAGTADIYEEAAESLGLITKRGSGKARPNVSALLTLLARSIEDGTIDIEEFVVTPAKLSPKRAAGVVSTEEVDQALERVVTVRAEEPERPRAKKPKGVWAGRSIDELLEDYNREAGKEDIAAVK